LVQARLTDDEKADAQRLFDSNKDFFTTILGDKI
jgi:hypothetical protein